VPLVGNGDFFGWGVLAVLGGWVTVFFGGVRIGEMGIDVENLGAVGATGTLG
jgi:hypothetical protein